jgi:hypothetical protein
MPALLFPGADSWPYWPGRAARVPMFFGGSVQTALKN